MRVLSEQEPDPLHTFEHLATTVADFQGNRLHPFTGEYPLGQDMGGPLLTETAAALGALARAEDAALLERWAHSWQETAGALERIHAWANPPEAWAAAFIAGPETLPDGAPAVRVDAFFPLPLRENLQPDRLSLIIGFADDQDRFTRQVTYAISRAALGRIKRGGAKALQPGTRALLGLARRANNICAAAQDPLKAAAGSIYLSTINDPEKAKDMHWLRSSKAEADGPAAEVCHLTVDPALYGPGRYLVFLRDSRNPNGPVLAYDDEEWKAFAGSAQDGEFDDL